MSTPIVYTPDEARRILKIGRSRFYELLRQGAIKSVKNGRRFLIPRECLMDYLKSMGTSQDEKGDD